MAKPKKIILTVTNDLNYDQRMDRICGSLAGAGYEVCLVGWRWRSSLPLQGDKSYSRHRLLVPWQQGKIMYLYYWIRLFFYLLFQKADALCAIDLDTILPVYIISRIKGVKRVYDAHEIFTEMQEVTLRPAVKKLWEGIGRFCVPHFPVGYTIGDCYANFFKEKYGVSYAVVRNATILMPLAIPPKPERFILYQGGVNVGRCFEYLIPAMQKVNASLVVCGKGNFFEEALALTRQYHLEDKITFNGYVPPDILKTYTQKAWVGITLFEAKGLSNELSMANRFFDYMHVGVPQLAMAYPEYEQVNERYELACLIQKPEPDVISNALNRLLTDDDYHQRLQDNALKARELYCWQQEEVRLLEVYRNLFASATT